MGYHVKMEELLDIQQSIRTQIREWDTQLEQVNHSLSQVVKTKTVQGKMGESVRSYVTEVHIQLVKALQQMLEEFEIRFTLYAKGYYDIDPSNVVEISQDLLEDQYEKGSIHSLEAYKKLKDLRQKRATIHLNLGR